MDVAVHKYHLAVQLGQMLDHLQHQQSTQCDNNNNGRNGSFLTWLAPVACNCRIHHVTVSIATRILIANLGQIDLSKVCLINLVYFKMQV